MNIDKAISHFEWKFKNSWKPTKKDIEAYNSIIEFKNIQQGVRLTDNELLAKLWIHQLMLLNATNMYSGEASIQNIDEILKQSVYDWCIKLHKNIRVMNFNVVMGVDPPDNLVELKYKELIESLEKEITLDNIIKFVEGNITRIVNKF